MFRRLRYELEKLLETQKKLGDLDKELDKKFDKLDKKFDKLDKTLDAMEMSANNGLPIEINRDSLGKNDFEEYFLRHIYKSK